MSYGRKKNANYIKPF